MRINNTKIYNQQQEPFPFNESKELAHFTFLEGEWKDDILVKTITKKVDLDDRTTMELLFH